MAETADPLGFSIESQRLARELFGTRVRVSVLRIGVFGAAVGLFLALGGSHALREATRHGAAWVAALEYFSTLYLALAALSAPFSAYSHVLERRYGLSRQGWPGWVRDLLKSVLLGYAFSLIAVEVLYFLLREFPSQWWILAWFLGIAVAFLGSIVAPVILVRLFFRLDRLADANLEERFRALAARAGIPLLGVFVLRASEKTRRSNAALAGMGRTRRVIVTDTLLQDQTPDEVESILAHEIAHQKHRDPIVGLGVLAATSFVTLGILRAALPRIVGPLNLEGIADVAGLPVIMLITAIISSAIGPLEHAFSRWREDRADRFALELTGKRDAFASAMAKLHDANLSLARPPRLFEVLAMSHPAAWRRVARARKRLGASP